MSQNIPFVDINLSVENRLWWQGASFGEIGPRRLLISLKVGIIDQVDLTWVISDHGSNN